MLLSKKLMILISYVFWFFKYFYANFTLLKTLFTIASYFLTVLILINSLRVSITFAYYEIDPVGFIEQLCENKDKPELKCNGKCHLKKVAQSSSSENKNDSSIIDFKELLLFKVNSTSYTFYNINFKQKPIINYTNLYSYLSFYECFHPPKALITYKA